MATNIKRIAVLTSGGDAPGMNAAIRAVVRASIFNNLEVYGVMRGYEGLINGDIVPMVSNSVSNIIQRGGTILKSARSEKFRTLEGRQQAFDNLKKFDIDAVVCIGGDGTFNEVATAMVGIENITLGIIPAGTGNDFIQILGFPNRFEEKHWNTFFKMKTTQMDVGNCNGKYFFMDKREK